jgi:hypothetical protein
MSKKATINIEGTEIILLSQNKEDYISLTDMAKFKNAEIPATVISHWMSTNFSINYMGIWEQMYKPDFNLTGFREIKMLSTETGFALSPKQCITMTNAVGIVSKAGRYGGGTFAHSDIAFEFASWLSPEFKYYLISEFERLKIEETQQKSLEWNLQRTCLNYDFQMIYLVNMISYGKNHKNQSNHTKITVQTISGTSAGRAARATQRNSDYANAVAAAKQ